VQGINERIRNANQRYQIAIFMNCMSSHPKYSVIVPVFNRPQEAEELLLSLTQQTFKNFEVLLIEDGSTISSQAVFEKFSARLSIQYFLKPNTGPGPSRNYGFAKARGDYFVVFDSDCIIPEHYFETVDNYLKSDPLDSWGGPDRGHENFSPLQQAMGFTMSSVLTTGGIRGNKKHLGAFQPRSFNMGISRQVFEKSGGFRFDRYAEDIEFSIRMRKFGFKVGLIPDAFVFHKRRTTLKQFFRQVSNFGRGRVHVGRAHPGEVKLTHWFPTFFALGLVLTVLAIPFNAIFSTLLAMGYAVYSVAILASAFTTTHSIWVSILAIPAAWVQLTGYGLGFLKEKLKTYIGN
jgi:glycosyltransferase involved in cell wall biosynthesis